MNWFLWNWWGFEGEWNIESIWYGSKACLWLFFFPVGKYVAGVEFQVFVFDWTDVMRNQTLFCLVNIVIILLWTGIGFGFSRLLLAQCLSGVVGRLGKLGDSILQACKTKLVSSQELRRNEKKCSSFAQRLWSKRYNMELGEKTFWMEFWKNRTFEKCMPMIGLCCCLIYKLNLN